MIFNASLYKHDYYRAHKAELLAYNKKYYARPENKDYFLNYRKARREQYRQYAKNRRRLIKAGLWIYRDPKKNKAPVCKAPSKATGEMPANIRVIQTRWQAYFDAKAASI